MPQVVKKDGSRADFDRDKLRGGLQRALRKRPVPTELGRRGDRRASIAAACCSLGEREVPTARDRRDGDATSSRKLDKVAYIRFASVYRSFEDVGRFPRRASQEVKSPRERKRRK